MTYYVGSMPFGANDIQHYGVKGMKWGIRKYQNADGTLTAEGRRKYQNKYDRAQARSDAFNDHYALEGGRNEKSTTNQQHTENLTNTTASPRMYDRTFVRHTLYALRSL